MVVPFPRWGLLASMAAVGRFGAVLRHPSRSQLVPLGVLSLVSAAATASVPVLHNTPLLLVALCPRLPFLVLAAGTVPLAPFLAVGTVRLCVADPFHFQLGRRYGATAARRTFTRVASIAGEPSRRLVAAVRRLFRRLGPLALPIVVLVRPCGRHLALAGAAGMSSRTAATLDVVGTLAYLAVVFTSAAAIT